MTAPWMSWSAPDANAIWDGFMSVSIRDMAPKIGYLVPEISMLPCLRILRYGNPEERLLQAGGKLALQAGGGDAFDRMEASAFLIPSTILLRSEMPSL